MRIDNPARIPWWLWPNVLNLDAPLITLAWQELFARTAGVAVTSGERAALFLAVWIIYALDRLADGLRLRVSETSSPRHRFSHDHARPLADAIAIALAAEAGLALALLPRDVLLAGGILGAAVAAYFAWNHLAGTRFGRGLLKELAVSVVFAVGAGLVPLVRRPSGLLVAGIAAFAATCVANCLLIARLERWRDLDRGELSIAARLAPSARPGKALALAVAAILAVAALLGLATPATLGSLAAAAMIAGAGWIERAHGPDAAAAWADLALFTGGIAGVAISSGVG